MRTDKLVKIVFLNLGIAVADTVLFSPGLIGMRIGADALATALGITVILMSVVIFAYGNFKLLTEKETVIQPRELKTHEDCITALKYNLHKKTFEKDIKSLIEQIERFQNKKDTIEDILLQKFDKTEMSYSKFEGAITDVENVFYLNIRSIINKMNAFDEEDYNSITKGNQAVRYSSDILTNKMDIYNEYFTFIKNAIVDSEEIILKFDRLLLEISNYNSLEGGEIENMSAMKEIDDLINKAKFYK